jgi:hypothetical protein
MACNALIEQNPNITYAFARQIDSVIHGPIPYTPDEDLPVNASVRLAVKYPEFIQHQNDILAMVEGCEKEVFNDPRAFYLGNKPHLSGITGTMSTLLTNGFLHLYNELLKRVPSLKVNADVDLLLLLNLVKHTESMPDEELALVKEIAQRLYPKRESNIFTPEWYTNYTTTIIQLDDLLLDTYKYYIYGDPPQKYGLTTGLDFLRGFVDQTNGPSANRQAIKDFLQKAEQNGYIYSHQYRLWETRPPYVLLSPPILETKDADTIVSTIIPFLKTIFPPKQRGGRRARKTMKRRRQRKH